jgi:hypothetical protein
MTERIPSTQQVPLTQQIPCNFVGSFKVGDNLVFNADLLCKLTAANADGAFNKPIVLQVGSIIEAALAEIIYRAQNFNREGVPNISEADRAEIEGKKIDKFNSVIDVLKKYSVLDTLGAGIYDELHKLRKYRNKIHIQDDIGIEGVSRDEADAFSAEICAWAIGLNMLVIKYLSDHLPRPAGLHGYVNPLTVPKDQPTRQGDA